MSDTVIGGPGRAHVSGTTWFLISQAGARQRQASPLRREDVAPGARHGPGTCGFLSDTYSELYPDVDSEHQPARRRHSSDIDIAERSIEITPAHRAVEPSSAAQNRPSSMFA